MDNNFLKYVLDNGGVLKRLELPVSFSEGLGLCNPSIFIDGNDILVNVRRVNYMFHMSMSHVWNTAFGPVNYHHPDNDVKLRTENYLCKIDSNLNVIDGSVKHVDYSKFNKEPKWGFVGEEDVRIVRWDDKLYLTGCRRDIDDKGTSRMELSEVDANAVEMSRTRVPAPFDDNSYCEKNWMPVIDEPYTYVKWCNPLQVVKYNHETGKTEEVLLKEYSIASNDPLCDLRGSSQVIKVDGYRIAIVHEVNLWTNRYNEREARYYTRFIVWDEGWNIVKLSDRFWFMDFPVEFTTGIAYMNGNFIIPFAVSDNAAFICAICKDALFSYIGLECDKNAFHDVGIEGGTDKLLLDYVMHINSPEKSYMVGFEYFSRKQWSEAHAFFLNAAEKSVADKTCYKKVGYDAFYMAQKCLEMCGGRMEKAIRQYCELIDWDSTRCEAYYELSLLNYGGTENRGDFYTALGYASILRDKISDNMELVEWYLSSQPIKNVIDRFMMQYYICCYRCSKGYVAVDGLKNLIENGCKEVSDYIKSLGLHL